MSGRFRWFSASPSPKIRQVRLRQKHRIFQHCQLRFLLGSAWMALDPTVSSGAESPCFKDTVNANNPSRNMLEISRKWCEVYTVTMLEWFQRVDDFMIFHAQLWKHHGAGFHHFGSRTFLHGRPYMLSSQLANAQEYVWIIQYLFSWIISVLVGLQTNRNTSKWIENSQLANPSPQCL